MEMCKENEENCASQNESQEEMFELLVEIPVDALTKLSQCALAKGQTLEQMVAQIVRELAE